MQIEVRTLEQTDRENYIAEMQLNTAENLYKTYLEFAELGDKEESAYYARAYRNKLLDECDNMMVSDRPNVDVEAWKTYRQALRDISKQEGFPLSIEFPQKP